MLAPISALEAGSQSVVRRCRERPHRPHYFKGNGTARRTPLRRCRACPAQGHFAAQSRRIPSPAPRMRRRADCAWPQLRLESSSGRPSRTAAKRRSATRSSVALNAMSPTAMSARATTTAAVTIAGASKSDGGSRSPIASAMAVQSKARATHVTAIRSRVVLASDRESGIAFGRVDCSSARHQLEPSPAVLPVDPAAATTSRRGAEDATARGGADDEAPAAAEDGNRRELAASPLWASGWSPSDRRSSRRNRRPGRCRVDSSSRSRMCCEPDSSRTQLPLSTHDRQSIVTENKLEVPRGLAAV